MQYGIEIGVAGPAGVLAAVTDAAYHIATELQLIEVWLAFRGVQSTPQMLAEIRDALLQQRDVDLGYFALEWTTVKYTYGYGEASASINHLAFALIWRV